MQLLCSVTSSGHLVWAQVFPSIIWDKSLSKCKQDLWVHHRTWGTREKLFFSTSFLKKIEFQGKCFVVEKKRNRQVNPRRLQKNQVGTDCKEVITRSCVLLRVCWIFPASCSHSPPPLYVLYPSCSAFTKYRSCWVVVLQGLFFFLSCEWL